MKEFCGHSPLALSAWAGNLASVSLNTAGVENEIFNKIDSGIITRK